MIALSITMNHRVLIHCVQELFGVKTRMTITYRERTVAFYEVKFTKNGEEHRFGNQLDFPAMINGLAEQEMEDRTFAGENDLIGDPLSVNGEPHFALHKVKDAGDWVGRADFKNGKVEQLITGEGEGYIDTSVVSFASFGNVFGMMQGSVGAPSHKAVELWLRKLGGFGDDLIVRPVMAPSEIEKLNKGVALQRVELKVSPGTNLGESPSALASAINLLNRGYPDLTVTLSVSSSLRGKARPKLLDSREQLLSDVSALGDSVSRADRAKVGLLFADGDGFGSAQLTELVEHHITAKRKVVAVDKDGNAIRLSGAVTAIALELESQEEALKNALGINV